MGAPVAIAALAMGIFIADTVTPYEIAAATFYVVVVLLAARLWRRGQLVGVSAACVVLTILSYLLTRRGDFEVGLANTAISLLAIAATTYLAIRMQAAHDQVGRARANLERVARITVLGELAASIAHEVNQPLAAISANASACARWLETDPPNLPRARDSIAGVVQDAGRASDTLSRVRALTRGGGPEKAWIDVNRLIGDTLGLLRASLSDNRIEARADPADGPVMVYVDPVQVQQLLINLTINAVDAINEKGGEVREIRIGAQQTRGGDVRIAVVDSGVGLSADRIGGMFDAFHSTKAHGMGIGLSICRSIVETHGGRLTASSRRQGGAEFAFTLPGGPASPA